MLFVPGNNMKMITKAATLPADVIILDLEDAVPLPDKETARVMSRDTIRVLKSTGAYVFVRINALTTGLAVEDVKLVAIDGLGGIVLPKAEAESDVVELDGMLAEIEKNKGLELENFKIIPLVETAKGVVNAYEIASASKRIVAVGFGAGDYYRDLGRSVSYLSPEQTELLYARSQTVIASTAAGVQPLDTVFFGLLTDMEGFTKEAMLALRLGFKGKFLIHPTQVEIVNKIFSPSLEEVAYASRVAAAFEEGQAKGLGAISFEGKMIDYMTYQQARTLVDFAELIAKKEKRRKQPSTVSLSQFFASAL